jgi:hypothetical protein
VTSPPVTDDDIRRHASAMGRAARRLGEPEYALKALWSAWCEKHHLDSERSERGWRWALAAFGGRELEN